MTYVDLAFPLFAAALLLVYFLLPLKARPWAVTAAGIVFVLSYGWKKLPLLLVCAGLVYLCARRIARVYEDAEAAAARDGITGGKELKQIRKAAKEKARVWLILGLIAALGLLVLAKTASLFVQSLSGKLSLIVPLGWSYTSLSLAAYLADVYWRRDEAERSPLRFLQFLFYFPRLVQGPVSRYKTLAPQLREGHDFDWDRFCLGLQLMLWGYFKKCVIADVAAGPVAKVLSDPAAWTGPVVLFTLCMSVAQIYCDFSGYMDIVRGLSQILGIDLEENFSRPFFARSAAEFWRRWHMSLGAFFKDYVFIPLTISPALGRFYRNVSAKIGKGWAAALRVIVPSVCVWTLTALWHGTGWDYAAWGLWWAALIIGAELLKDRFAAMGKKLGIRTESPVWRVFQSLRTALLFLCGRLLTAPGSLSRSAAAVKTVFTRFTLSQMLGLLVETGYSRKSLLALALGLVLIFLVSLWQERHEGASLREAIAAKPLPLRWAVWLLLLCFVTLFGAWGPGYDASVFMYAGF